MTILDATTPAVPGAGTSSPDLQARVIGSRRRQHPGNGGGWAIHRARGHTGPSVPRPLGATGRPCPGDPGGRPGDERRLVRPGG